MLPSAGTLSSIDDWYLNGIIRLPPTFITPHLLPCAGTLSSIDDWYLNGDSQLVVTETSNNVYDTSLYRLSTSQAALSWHRKCKAGAKSVTLTWATVLAQVWVLFGFQCPLNASDGWGEVWPGAGVNSMQ